MAYNLIWEETGTGQSEPLKSGDVIRAGELFETGHVTIGVIPTKVSVSLKKELSPTGTAELKLINSANSEKASFGTIDVTTLTTSFVEHEFINDLNTAAIADGDRLAIYYSGSGGSVHLGFCDGCSEANTNGSYYISSWTNRTRLCTMKVYAAGTSSTSTRFPPPPIVLGGL